MAWKDKRLTLPKVVVSDERTRDQDPKEVYLAQLEKYRLSVTSQPKKEVLRKLSWEPPKAAFYNYSSETDQTLNVKNPVARSKSNELESASDRSLLLGKVECLSIGAKTYYFPSQRKFGGQTKFILEPIKKSISRSETTLNKDPDSISVHKQLSKIPPITAKEKTQTSSLNQASCLNLKREESFIVRGKIDYNSIEREHRKRVEANRKKLRIRKLWRDAFKKVVDFRHIRKQKVYKIFEDSSKELVMKSRREKSNVVTSHYGAVVDNLNNILRTEWGQSRKITNTEFGRKLNNKIEEQETSTESRFEVGKKGKSGDVDSMLAQYLDSKTHKRTLLPSLETSSRK